MFVKLSESKSRFILSNHTLCMVDAFRQWKSQINKNMEHKPVLCKCGILLFITVFHLFLIQNCIVDLNSYSYLSNFCITRTKNTNKRTNFILPIECWIFTAFWLLGNSVDLKTHSRMYLNMLPTKCRLISGAREMFFTFTSLFSVFLPFLLDVSLSFFFFC